MFWFDWVRSHTTWLDSSNNLLILDHVLTHVKRDSDTCSFQSYWFHAFDWSIATNRVIWLVSYKAQEGGKVKICLGGPTKNTNQMQKWEPKLYFPPWWSQSGIWEWKPLIEDYIPLTCQLTNWKPYTPQCVKMLLYITCGKLIYCEGGKDWSTLKL